MGISVRNEGAKVNSNINVTPMVDVMLVLLIIFMVITPMLQKGTIVEMAKTNNPVQMPDADKEDALIVAVQRDGKIFFDAQMVSPEELTQKVKERVSSRTNKQVCQGGCARPLQIRSGRGGRCSFRRRRPAGPAHGAAARSQ